MTYTSAWPLFVCVPLLVVFAAGPMFAVADAAPTRSASRVNTLDGLRGFLALAVFFQHAVIYHDFLAQRSWRPPASFYETLGEMGVDLFFMITGFLFWAQMKNCAGRPDWRRLYVGRVARIAPLYFVAIMIMLVAVFLKTGHLRVHPLQLAAQLSQWAALGLLGAPDVNGYPNTSLVLCGVTWSLKYEWLFYISLIATHFAARSPLARISLPALGLLMALVFTALRELSKAPPYSSVFVALFCAGMLVAAVVKTAPRSSMYKSAASMTVMALTAIILIFFTTTRAWVPILLISTIFYLIASGADIFGLLTSRPAKRLGDISFGIYLLQGLVFTTVYWGATVRSYALSSPWSYWLTTLVAGLLLVSIAAIAHVVVERPGVALGARLTRGHSRRSVGLEGIGSPQPALSLEAI